MGVEDGFWVGGHQEDDHDRLIVYWLGYPMVEALVDKRKKVIASRLFPGLFHALNGYTTVRDKCDFLDRGFPKGVDTWAFPDSMMLRYGRDFKVPRWLEKVCKAIAILLNNQLMDRLVYHSIQSLIYECPKDKNVSRDLALTAIEMMNFSIEDKASWLSIAVGRRKVLLVPVLYDEEKDAFLHLVMYGPQDNPIPLMAIWFDDEADITFDPKLSANFNNRAGDENLPWMKEGSISLEALIGYLRDHPEVFDSTRITSRRKGLTQCLFEDLLEWVDPHLFVRMLLRQTEWMRKCSRYESNGGTSTIMALKLAADEIEMQSMDREGEEASALDEDDGDVPFGIDWDAKDKTIN